MSTVTLQSPAKLNLYLKVQNKRKNGFHNIKTIFQRIDLVDTIKFSSNNSGKIKIKCNDPNVPVGSKNLVYKVAKAIKQDFEIEKGINIIIKKRIPVAAGLAGGSSNAATAILGLNRLWNLGLEKAKMLHYAKKIGSDVAFFIHDSSWALGTGRGDIIKPIYNRNKIYYILIVPRVKLYSGEVYGGIKLQLTKRVDNATILIRNLRKGDISGISEFLRNDLENVVLRLCPKLLKLKQKLKTLGFKGVMVSGSGPAVFGIAENERQAKKAESILKRRYSRVFIVRTL